MQARRCIWREIYSPILYNDTLVLLYTVESSDEGRISSYIHATAGEINVSERIDGRLDMRWSPLALMGCNE